MNLLKHTRTNRQMVYEYLENNLKKVEKAIELYVKADGVDLAKLSFIVNALNNTEVLGGKFIITVSINSNGSFGLHLAPEGLPLKKGI